MLVDADGDLDKLASVLVPYVDAVLARVLWSDFVDDEAGELAAVERDLGVLSAGDFLLILEPGDLGGRFAPHGAGQAQGLERITCLMPFLLFFQILIKYCKLFNG